LPLYYLESSALVKLYVQEPGSNRMLALAAENGNQFMLVTLAAIELRSAVRRRERDGDVPSAAAAALLERFREHLASKFVRQMVNEAVLEIAAHLIDRHPLRAMDALQLAGYLVIRMSARDQVLVFVCSDERLLKAAELEGAPVLNPAAQVQ
jgi:uncharacterized protein